MKIRLKLITITGIVIVGVVAGSAYFIMNQNKLKDNQSKQYINEDSIMDNDEDLEEEDPIEETDMEDDTMKNNNELEVDHSMKSVYGGLTNGSKKVNRNENIVPTSPSKPSGSGSITKPEGNQKLEDLIITNAMIKNGTYIVGNKKYNNVTISSNIKDHVKIILDTIEIKGELILEGSGKYQLDIMNSNISTLTTVKQLIQFSLLRMRTVTTMNKELEGPTVNLQKGSTIQSAMINGNVEINGEKLISNIKVNETSEVVLNVPVHTVSLSTQGLVAVNKKVNNLTNLGDSAKIIVNAPITTLTNHTKSTIYVNNGNTITKFNNNGDNTIVSGNGTIIETTINAKNTRIYTNLTNTPVLMENTDNILVRQEKEIKIESAISTAQGVVSFTLSKEVDNLTIKDISVICNAGKSITLYNLTTTDKKTYTLTTSYYKNDSYALYITLPNGNIISKDFDTDYANPNVNKVVVERVSDEEATLELYGLDEGGYIYYVLEEASTKEVVSESSIKTNGKSELVKVGYNIISIKDLAPGKSYHLYYVVEGFYENTSKVKGPIEVPSQLKQINQGKYQINSAREEIPNRFVFTLNRIPEKELTLDDFEIICPTEKNLTLKGAEFFVSPDLLTYIIVVPDNYGHKDNKYTVKIQVSETEKIDGSFVSHFDPPRITGEEVIRTGEETAELRFYSDEEGIVYFGVYEWNGGIYDYNSSTPFASDVITGTIKSQKQELNAEGNTILLNLKGITITKNTRVWALFVDKKGNYRVGFVDHYKIPTSVNNDNPNLDSSVQITKFNITNNNFISMDFNETISWVSSNDIQLTIIGSGSLPSKLTYSIDNDTPKHLSIDILNYTLTKGTYELAINITDTNGKPVKLIKRFEVN